MQGRRKQQDEIKKKTHTHTNCRPILLPHITNSLFESNISIGVDSVDKIHNSHVNFKKIKMK
jgi:hypothetical protein